MKRYPDCIGGLNPESDWCNNECPEAWLTECLDRIIAKMAPRNSREIVTVLYFKDRIKTFAWECKVRGNKK